MIAFLCRTEIELLSDSTLRSKTGILKTLRSLLVMLLHCQKE